MLTATPMRVAHDLSRFGKGFGMITTSNVMYGDNPAASDPQLEGSVETSEDPYKGWDSSTASFSPGEAAAAPVYSQASPASAPSAAYTPTSTPSPSPTASSFLSSMGVGSWVAVAAFVGLVGLGAYKIVRGRR